MAAICTAMASAGTVVLPWIIKDLVDQVLSEKDAEMLTYIALSVVVIFLFRGFFFYGQSYLISYVGQRVVIDIRREVFKKIQRLSMAFYDKNKTGTIMSYVTNDVSALQSGLVDNIVDMITESVILIASIVAMIYLDWKLFLFTFCTFPVVILFIDFFYQRYSLNSGSGVSCNAINTAVCPHAGASCSRMTRRNGRFGPHPKEPVAIRLSPGSP